MIKKGERYMLIPTIVRSWVPAKLNKQLPRACLPLKGIYDAILIKILKNDFVFDIPTLNGKWKIPFEAVEVWGIINNPFNIDALDRMCNKLFKKFCEGGFAKLSTGELRVILANQYLKDGSPSTYAIDLALGHEGFSDRGDIIRTLRNTFDFRDTKENRREVKKSIKE